VDDNLVSKNGETPVESLGALLYANSASEAMKTSCPADNCRKLVSTAPMSGLPSRFDHPFRVITGGEVEVDVQHLSETTEEVRKQTLDRGGSSVTGYSVLRENIEHKELCDCGEVTVS